jgi:signal transduction histidine kinase
MSPLLNPYAFTAFITAIVTMAVGIFVYAKRTQSAIHRSFLIFSASIAQWSFFTALHTIQDDPGKALLWSRVCHIGAMLIPVFFYYFTLKITGRERKGTLTTGFILATVLIIVNFTTNIFIAGLRHDVGFRYFTKASPLYSILIAFFFSYVLLGLLHLWREVRISTGTRKKHLQYFFWSSVLGYGIGAINFYPVYGVTIPPYPYSAACGAVYSSLIAYAILRHKLFDIELIVRKGLVFGILFGTVYITVSALIFLVGYFVAGRSLPLLSGISIALAMLLYEPLKGLLTRLTNRFLFQKKAAYTMLIQTLTDKLSNIREPQSLAAETVDFLTNHMALDWAAFYLSDPESMRFTLRALKGISFHDELREPGPIKTLIERRHTPFILSPFDIAGDLEPQTKARLRGERIEAIVPIYVENKLHGIVLLGKKKSDQSFDSEDETLLQALMDETSMLLLSGKLLREANLSNLELGQRMKMAALIKLARGVHHEVRNPLHSISLSASAMAGDFRLGRYRNVPFDAVAHKINGRIQSMLEDINRVQDSLGRFARFARPDRDFELTALSLRTEIDKFIALMMEGQKLDQIRVHISVPESLKVLASEGALQEIFFNLFNNAYDAMNGSGELFFEAAENTEFIELKIRDTGPGIPKEILPNIFEEYFTAKTQSEAAGIGLSITKHRIEKMGGSIEVGTAPQGGAEFTFRLRKAEHEAHFDRR